MRTAGVCSIQQSLSPEAITIVKQAINLARRRGHAQVTPIHVATVMLASPAGLLRSACLKSSLNSHPYQCKALELCFNVALNRLPATTSSPLLGPQHQHSHHHYPALANALMAAFKRAQAHQRRGSIEAQQQPILALKIDTEQLVVSILDDPSVSRVMREAGFSSTLLKSYVQQSLSSQTTTTNINISSNLKPNYSQTSAVYPLVNPFELGFSNPSFSKEVVKNEDVSSVIDAWARRREKSSVVVVGECLSSCEGVLRAVKESVQRGDHNNNIPIELKYVQFLNCPLLSMENLSRNEIDMKLGEIRGLIKGCVGRGVVLYLGDIKWVAEYWAYYKNGDQQKKQTYNYNYNSNYDYNYCPIEHLVMGLRKLVFGNHVENGRVWLMAISTFNSFMKCKAGNPSLETLLDLHPLTIPSASLDLSLNLESKKNSTVSTHSRLPLWLQKCKEESREQSPLDDQEESSMQKKELCKKLISSEKIINFTMSCSPTSSNSASSYEHDNYCKPILSTWPPIFEEHQFLSLSNNQKPELLSNPNSIPNSASSSEATDVVLEVHDRFKENNAENLEALCSELEKKVPWQKDIILEIATTVLRCRSRKSKQETWLSFLGVDKEGKLELAKELAKLVFGIRSFKSIGLGDFSPSSTSTRADDSTEDDHCSRKNHNKKKRGRDELGAGVVVERLAHAVSENPHRVFYVEDVEGIDKGSLESLKRAMESGKFVVSDGETVPIEDAIVILSCDSFSSASRACSPLAWPKRDDAIDDEACSSSPLDLNMAVGYDGNGNGDGDNSRSVGGIRILDAVDKQILFRVQAKCPLYHVV